MTKPYQPCTLVAWHPAFVALKNGCHRFLHGSFAQNFNHHDQQQYSIEKTSEVCHEKLDKSISPYIYIYIYMYKYIYIL